MVPEIEAKAPRIKVDNLVVEAEKPVVHLSDSFTAKPDAVGFLHIRTTERAFKQDDVRIAFKEENIYILTMRFYPKRPENEPRKG